MSSVADKEQIKRDLSAIGIAVLIHLIIGGAFLASHFLFATDIEVYRGPVLVKLGRADAPDEETDSLPVAPVSSEEEQSSTVEESAESTEEVQSGNPQETVKPDDLRNEAAVERPVSDDDAGDRGDSETSSGESSPGSSTANEEDSTVEAEETVTVTKGSEEGNAFETTYDASPGLVGRNLWIPIYLYMPLPQFISKDTFDSIKGDAQSGRPGKRSAEDKQKFLLNFYELLGDEYYLSRRLTEDERPPIWSILEDGSYDLKQAEYKDGKILRDVVLHFTVATGNDERSISDVQIQSSSGYSEIDDAVKYGFLKASFYNSSDIPVKGRFTYRFD